MRSRWSFQRAGALAQRHFLFLAGAAFFRHRELVLAQEVHGGRVHPGGAARVAPGADPGAEPVAGARPHPVLVPDEHAEDGDGGRDDGGHSIYDRPDVVF